MTQVLLHNEKLTMAINPHVVNELRSMFREGATPSRLMKHIVASHPDERNWHVLIQEYFRESFGVPIVRGLKPGDNYDHKDGRYAFLNVNLSHEIISHQNEWNSPEEGDQGSWIDSLVATSHEQLLRQIHCETLPELSRCWPHLSPEEQHYIRRTLATSNGLYETVKVLAALAERLQQRLNSLEIEQDRHSSCLSPPNSGKSS